MEVKLEGLFTETRQFVQAIQANENELKKLLNQDELDKLDL